MILLVIAAAVIMAAWLRYLHVDSGAPNPSDRTVVNDPGVQLNPSIWPDDALTLANLGHATLLINYFGVSVLTDPTLFNRIGFAVDSWFTVGPRQMVPPVLPPAALQSVRVILITHAHMDHLDLPPLKALPKSATVIACGKCTALIRPLGFSDMRELRWGESTTVAGLRVAAMGARH